MKASRITDHGKMQHCSFFGFYQQVFFGGNKREIRRVALVLDSGDDFVKTVDVGSVLFSEKAFLINENQE